MLTRYKGFAAELSSSQASFSRIRSDQRSSFPTATKTSLPRLAIVRRGPACGFESIEGLLLDVGANSSKPGEGRESHDGVCFSTLGILARSAEGCELPSPMNDDQLIQ